MGGLSKGRAAAANRKKLLQRPLALRALNQVGDYLPPTRLSDVIARLWPDACQDDHSDISQIRRVGQDTHTGTWGATVQKQHLPAVVQRLLDPRTFKHLNVTSSLVATALTVVLIATAPEEVGLPECADTVEAAGCHITKQFESVPAHVQSYSCSTLPGTGCLRAWPTPDWPLRSE